MAIDHFEPFATKAAPELSGSPDTIYPVAIIGAGPIGLAAAVDLALQGVKVLVLDDNNVVSVGSRAICWAKRSLEIFDRLGVGDRMLEKGVTWKIGRLFNGDKEVFQFDLLPEAGHKMPAFINLQQYYVEQYLVERAAEFPDLIDLRFNSKVTQHSDTGDCVQLNVESEYGNYALQAEYVLACDGAGSATRERMGLEFEGQAFEERFLIADIEMETNPFESQDKPERWFWFKPPFHPGQSALLHKQPDNIYRIDLQLGADADPEEEKKPENVIPRIKQIVGDKPFKLDWVSVYRFTCAKLDNLVYGRLLFVGDSAHVVSPFGARGGNGGIHDVDNLCWKLAAVLQGKADASLLDTYNTERLHGASENVMHSARATGFMSPSSEIEMLFRDEVLELARTLPFARTLINSGRLSKPCKVPIESVSAQADKTGSDKARIDKSSAGHALVGHVVSDVPLSPDDWLMKHVGHCHTLLLVDEPEPDLSVALPVVHLEAGDIVDQRYAKGAYLVRPDQHVMAHWGPGNVNSEAVQNELLRSGWHGG